jgi:hypothetical protein
VKRNSLLDLACLLFGLSCHFLANANNYYVSASRGRDVNSGTSADAPWQSMSKVNRTAFATGDRVYFLVGDVWDDESLSVNWSGTADRHAIIGAYRWTSGGALSYDVGTADQRPVIDDHYRWGARAFTAATGSNPAINVLGSYVDIENIEVRRSGWGIRIKGKLQSDVTVTNVFINGAYQCGIQANGVTRLTIQDSELFNAEAFRGIFNEPGNWCSTIGIQGSHDILVQNNYIHESWGEGINVFYGSTNAVIRNNLLYANKAVGIYMGALNGAIVHGNLVLGTADRQFWRTRLSPGPGIALDNESYEFVGGSTTSGSAFTGNGSLCPLGPYGIYNTGGGAELCPNALQNIQIYDNLVAGTSAGLAVWFASYPAAYTNVKVLNNTFVDNEQQLELGGQNTSRFIVTNNIFLSLSSGMIDVSGSNYGITFDTNYWSQGRPATVGSDPLASATDVTEGVELSQMTGWRRFTKASLSEALNFMPTARSGTLGKGSRRELFFATDYFGAALRNPVDLGAIAGSVPSASPLPPPAASGNTAMPNPVTAGAVFQLTGSFMVNTAATGVDLYFWLKRPDGKAIVETSVKTDFEAYVATPVTIMMRVPAGAPAGLYTISAGAYSGTTALRPFEDNFASLQVR